MRRHLTTQNLMLVLLIIVILQITLFTFFKINAISDTEALVSEVYRRQLQTILSSVNQHALDTINGWAGGLERTLQDYPDKLDAFYARVLEFQQENRAWRFVFILENLEVRHIITGSEMQKNLPNDARAQLEVSIARDRNTLKRLKRWQSVGYRKIHTAILGDSSQVKRNELLLIFSPEVPSDDLLVGMTIDIREFIETILSSRLEMVAGTQFELGIMQEGEAKPVYSTQTFDADEILARTKLWVLPDYYIGINAATETIEQLAASRKYTDLSATLVLNLLLFVGAWLLYRNIKKEMELSQLKSDFVSNVSHELRTPLSMIRMFAETLEMKRVSSEERKQEYYGIIRQESERMTHLINNILNFGKMESGQDKLALEESDLNDMVREVLRNYSYQIVNHGFTLERELANDKIRVKTNPKAVAEAILNLLDNAIKYSKDEKRLKVKTGKEDGRAFIEIADMGIGVPQDQQKLIFEKFYRVSNGLVHNTRGSGLGLTLVKHIMLQHQGDVTVKSKSGQGSAFTLWFPYQSGGTNE